jgi:hypothetical protein
MTSYIVVGHPLGYIQGIPATEAQFIHDQMQGVGVGGTISLTVSGPSDTAAKGHGALK